MAPSPQFDRHDDNDSPHQDDAIIGTVFFRSLTALVLVCLIVAGIWALRRPKMTTEPVIDKDTSQIKSLSVDRQSIPDLPFKDITSEAGIECVHLNGALGDKLLPETMGGGVAFLDFNSDGHQDLLFVGGRDWGPTADGKTVCHLYANRGDGNFDDVTESSGLTGDVYGMGCAIGDYDNDGDPDVFIAALGGNRLFRNDGAQFTDVTEAAGIAGEDIWSSSAGFLDYDRDGDLDLFVCNYVQWTRDIDFELNYTLNGRDRAYGPPTSYRGLFPYLYRNEGDGSFEEVGKSAGLQIENPDTGSAVAKALAVVFADFDFDGWTDIMVANDTVQNQMFHNSQNGTFEEIGTVCGVGFDRNGHATGAMGIDVGFPATVRRAAIGVGNFANEMTSFYMAQESPLVFADQSLVEGIGAPSRGRLTFGLLFLDVDQDGRQDFLETNGHLEEEINEVQPSQTYLQTTQLFWNQGPDADCCYALVPEEKTGDLATPVVGRGAAYADIDGDGDLDVVITQVGRRPMLLRNDQDSGHGWLRVRLIGSTSNRDAIGSHVEAVVDGQHMYRVVSPTRSYLSQVELPVTFGLGVAHRVDRLTVTWPSGKTTVLEDIPGDQSLVVEEPE